MIRIGPAYPGRGIPWDHKGKTEVAQILISCNRNRINFMYFVYVEDGGTKLVLSEKIGREETSHSMETVNFDYPSEYITRVSGAPTKGLVSIDFNYQVAGKFGGFFGSYETDSIETIGFYIDPLQKLANQPGEIAVGGSDGLEASGETS
uniref:Jacalin-type lectin domain-containing protein n=1 Tax=Daucus carota subsp. sativus TaxID=79200 RepID=A0A161ZMD0_DAUCS